MMKRTATNANKRAQPTARGRNNGGSDGLFLLLLPFCLPNGSDRQVTSVH